MGTFGKKNNEPDPKKHGTVPGASDERPPGIMVSQRFGPKLTVPSPGYDELRVTISLWKTWQQIFFKEHKGGYASEQQPLLIVLIRGRYRISVVPC